MKSPRSLKFRIGKMAAFVTAVVFLIACGLTSMCYVADHHVVNLAKCFLIGSLWSLLPAVIGAGGVIGLWIDEQTRAQR